MIFNFDENQRPGESRDEWIARLDKEIECYDRFFSEYKNLCSGAPRHYTWFTNEERGLKLGGFFQTQAGKDFDREQRRLCKEWYQNKVFELNELINSYINKFGNSFYFRSLYEIRKEYGDRIMGRFTINGREHRTLGIDAGWFVGSTDIRSVQLYLAGFVGQKKHLLKPSRIARKKFRERIREEEENRKKALVAAALEKSRTLASGIKQKLPTNHPCPYCGGSLGSDYHADHIYPVSKGGLSRKENMVNVCSSCNLAKKALTLNVFIKRFELDRDAIESRLLKLGKDF